MLLLDTSAASAFMHRRPDALRRLHAEDPSTVYLCAIRHFARVDDLELSDWSAPEPDGTSAGRQP